MKITLCSSASFYRDVLAIQKQLESLGHEVLVPHTATVMGKTENFDIAFYKTWLKKPEDFHKKTALMRQHFEKIDQGDVLLVVNLEKDGLPGYIGGNGLLEMFYGWLQKKPIYLLHPASHKSPLYEEIMGLEPICLNGDLVTLRQVST